MTQHWREYMDHYKKELKKHVEKLFKKAQEIIAKRRGEVNRVKHNNFLSYYCRYNRESVDKRKKNKHKNTWKDAMAPKPLNRGFRDKKLIPREPTTAQLEQMIEFFEKELEKLDGPTLYEKMKHWYEKLRWECLYQQKPIIIATQKSVKSRYTVKFDKILMPNIKKKL